MIFIYILYKDIHANTIFNYIPITATVKANVALNRENNPTWGEQIFVNSGCIVRPQDVGQLTMKGGLKPGTSVSGIGEHVVGKNEGMMQWQVACYTLPDIMENYWGIRKPYVDVFLKIDVESYECKLIPSVSYLSCCYYIP